MEKRVNVVRVIASPGTIEKFHRYFSHVAVFGMFPRASVFLSFSHHRQCVKSQHFLCLSGADDTWLACSSTALMNLKSVGFGDREIKTCCSPEQCPLNPALQYDICDPTCWSLQCEGLGLCLGSDMQKSLANLILLMKDVDCTYREL